MALSEEQKNALKAKYDEAMQDLHGIDTSQIDWNRILLSLNKLKEILEIWFNLGPPAFSLAAAVKDHCPSHEELCCRTVCLQVKALAAGMEMLQKHDGD